MTCKRILIADDEPLYCQTTGELLRKAGFECVCVSNGNDAISALNDQSFDLVLSDLNMPGNFKMELLKDHSQQRPATPLIVITGVPSLPTAIESIRLGIADYRLITASCRNPEINWSLVAIRTYRATKPSELQSVITCWDYWNR